MSASSYYQVAILSECGPVRKNNEDAIAYDLSEDRQICCMVIADGMGGYLAGEVASQLFVQEVLTAFAQIKQAQQIDWTHWLKETIEQANLKILLKGTNNPEYHGMGTTGVVLICDADHYFIAWVGDSRAYLLRSCELKQLTQDHSMIQYLLDKGAISQAEADGSNAKNTLAKALGVKAEVVVDCVTGVLQQDDVFLLSTDGLHDIVAGQTINDILSTSKVDKSMCVALVQQGIEQASQDNLSVGIVKFISTI